MDIIYRVKEWDEHFENNRTRDMKLMRWVPVPNKHDGDGYTELVDHKEGSAHLGIWIALLQVASKCSERGTLLRDNGSPHTPKSLARVTRLPESMIGRAIDRLCSSDIGWMEVVDSEGLACDCGNPAPIPHPTDYGREGNRREKKEGKIVEIDSILSELTESRRKLLDTWLDYKTSTGKGYVASGLKALVKKLSKYSDQVVERAIEDSMANSWAGLFPEKVVVSTQVSPKGL